MKLEHTVWSPIVIILWLVVAALSQADTLENNPATQKTPQGDVIVGRAAGQPVYQIGQTFILGVSPDFDPDFSVQDGNDFPRVKLQPKKSWELKENRMGTLSPRMPRTLLMDFQPYEWFHLIDGDPETYWCSHASLYSDQEEAWIRIDLAVATPLAEVRLVSRKDGMGIPSELTLLLSSDLRSWTTVYHNVSQLPPAPGSTLRLQFNYSEPVRAIWIRASHLSRITGWWYAREQYAFSVAEVEAIDLKGNNAGLLSRGAGVTVSSTYYGDGLTAEEHELYWPIHYDLGAKWVRVNAWDDVLTWAYVEPNEKGKYYIDPRADQAITDTARNGVNLIFALDYGNWLYDADSPRGNYDKRDWVGQHGKRLPSLPTKTPGALQGFSNYARFMVRHFRDRVKYFEIWNEENTENHQNVNYGWGKTPDAAREFMKLVKAVAPVIREECPQCKIVLGSTAWFRSSEVEFLKTCMDEGAGQLVDVVGFHPFYGTDLGSEYYASYPERFRALKTYAAAKGFKGEYMATEANWSIFPFPSDNYGLGGEMRLAKNILRTSVSNLGLGIYSFYCETWNTSFPWNLGLFRGTFASNPLNTVMPSAGYYAFRTLSTVMDEAVPAQISVAFDGPAADFETYAFRKPSGDSLVSVSLSGSTYDGQSRSRKIRLSVKNMKAARITVLDLLNGNEQEVKWSRQGADISISNLNIPDYPIIVRILP